MDEPKKLHPVVWVAAVSVTLLSITGVGAILGIIPHAGGKNADPTPVAAVSQPAPLVEAPPAQVPAASLPSASAQAATPPAEQPVAAPVEQAPPVKAAKKKHHQAVQMAQAPGPDAAVPPPGTAYPPQDAPMAQPAAPPPCYDCGVIDNVRAVTEKGQGTGLGVVAGGVLGGVLGHQVGGGSGRDVATIVGAVAGGFAGNEIEKNQRKNTHYEITVRMDDGSTRLFTEANSPTWAMGQPVRVVNGAIQPR